jgi:Big-like domain-containing protein/List-Bact-rpt repeat protein
MHAARRIKWVIAVSAVVAIGGLFVGSAPAAGCGDSWVNAAGGAWETGSNWSTNAPPTSGQYACIEQALSAPVVLNSSPTIAGLTLGGSSGTAKLEGNGTLTLAGDSTIADTGVLTIASGGLVIHQTGTLTNHGEIIPASSGLQFVGNLANAADGLILSSSAGFYFDGPGTLTNNGELSIIGSGALITPFNGGSGASIVNAGSIRNTSTSNSTIGNGATLEETSGTTTGIPLQIDGGTLDLAGGGASLYRMVETSTLTGTIAAAQTVVLDGNISTTGSLTNNGTLTEFQGPELTLPSGDALTNNGLISLPGLNLNLAGNLHNTASGRIQISGGVFALQGAHTLTNDGTINVGPNSTLTTTGSTATIDNDGGAIHNGGTVTLSSGGGTFIEGAGTETGNLVAINAPSALDLTGGGASGFALNGGASISGNIAAGQIVQDGTMNATGSFTNSGTMFPRGGRTTLPSGDTLTNDGLIAGAGSFTLDGNLTNAVGGVINMQQVIGLAGSNETITNNGTIYLPCCGGIHIDGSNTSNNTFVNNGTYYDGTFPTGSSLSWGGAMPVTNSSVQAGASGDVVTMDGTVIPLPSGAEMPPPPVSPESSSYEFISVPGTNPPPIWALGCGFSVAKSNWAGSCSNAGGGQLTLASNTTLDPTITTVIGSGACDSNHSCSSTYGQPVTVTATVSSEYGPAPTGTVTLLADLVNQPNPDERVPYSLGTVPVSTTGGVTTGSVTTQLPPGQFQLSAIYNGDSSSLMSAAMFTSFQVQNIAQPTTTTTLTSSPAAPVFGNAVTLKATITPSQTGGAAPTGSVRFGLGSSQFALGDVPVVTQNGTTSATLTTTALPEGANTVYAVYSGDYNYGSSPLVSTTVTEGTPATPTHVTVTGPSTFTPGTTYSATATTDGTGAIRYSLASSPAPPQGMTIDGTGKVTFAVPASGATGFSYVVVASNATGRAQSSLVTVTSGLKRTVTVSTSGTGSGTVTSSPAGIDCGSTCSAQFPDGASVTLTAAAAAGSTFTGWSGAGCSGTGTCPLTLSGDRSVTATFTLLPPNTRLAKSKVNSKKRTATFAFKAVGVATGFKCALARNGARLAFHGCASPKGYRRLRRGKYTFAVKALNGALADPTPAKKKFTIKR